MTPAKAPYSFIGTWKLTSCETSHPELPYPDSSLTTLAYEGDDLRYQSESTWSDGRHTTVSAVLKTDGSWCPISGSSIGDAVSVQVLDDGSIEGNIRKGGANAGNIHLEVSSDRQTMTTHWDILAPGGLNITWKTTAQR